MTHASNAPLALPYGPLMIDIEGTQLTDADKQRLCHPLVGGFILFARNYESPAQLAALTHEIHALRSPCLPITIDHEGGRVQRCRNGFTRLPAMRSLGTLWEKDPTEAKQAAQAIGFVLAAELRAVGVDFAFTPVLDLDWGPSLAIGDRAFHPDPRVVCALASALIDGLREAGMGACGKHFPGHGWAAADSHLEIPIDERSFAELAPDLLPYRQITLDAVMLAHVIYPKVDENQAGFSTRWNDILRHDIGFNGLIFSDDLSMGGASAKFSNVVERVSAAWNAGCDVLLVCNSSACVDEVLANWHPELDLQRTAKIACLLPNKPPSEFKNNPRYLAGSEIAKQLIQSK